MTPRPMKELFDAMHHGKYEFDDLLSCDVEHSYERVSWPDRIIYKPSRKLKAYHRFLNSFLFEHLPTNSRVAYAYTKNSTPRRALAPHAGSRAFFRTDLAKFFDSITSPLILRVLTGNITPIADVEQHADRILKLTTVNDRLPIGFSTSPLISNACLKAFDDSLERVCHQRELIYTRYADDIIISSQDRQQLIGIDGDVLEPLLHQVSPEFRINRSKTKVTTVGRKVSALGMVILPSGQIAIDMETKRKVEYQLHFFIKDRARLLKIFDTAVAAGLQTLAGYISHINAADPDYLEKLRRRYGVTVIDSFLHRSAK